MVLITRLALSMQNELYGATTVVSPPWSGNEAGYSSQSAAQSDFLNDDMNFDTTGQDPETCTAPSSLISDNLSFTISNTD